MTNTAFLLSIVLVMALFVFGPAVGTAGIFGFLTTAGISNVIDSEANMDDLDKEAIAICDSIATDDEAFMDWLNGDS